MLCFSFLIRLNDGKPPFSNQHTFKTKSYDKIMQPSIYYTKNGGQFRPSPRNLTIVGFSGIRGTLVNKSERDRVYTFAESLGEEMFCGALSVDGGSGGKSFKIACVPDGTEQTEDDAFSFSCGFSNSMFVSSNTVSAPIGYHLVCTETNSKPGTLSFGRSKSNRSSSSTGSSDCVSHTAQAGCVSYTARAGCVTIGRQDPAPRVPAHTVRVLAQLSDETSQFLAQSTPSVNANACGSVNNVSISGNVVVSPNNSTDGAETTTHPRPFCDRDAQKICAAFAEARKNATDPITGNLMDFFAVCTKFYECLTNTKIAVLGRESMMAGESILAVNGMQARARGRAITLKLPSGRCVWADDVEVTGDFALNVADRDDCSDSDPALVRAEGDTAYFDAGCRCRFRCDHVVPKETMYVIAWGNTFTANGTKFALGEHAVAAAVFRNAVVSV